MPMMIAVAGTFLAIGVLLGAVLTIIVMDRLADPPDDNAFM